jgi:heparosan-N-sulfate-glucuronate 5-epimerase
VENVTLYVLVAVAGLVGCMVLYGALVYRKLFGRFDEVVERFEEERFVWESPPERDGVRGYYLVKRLALLDQWPVDEQGIPLVPYQKAGLRRNPVTVAQHALSILNTYVESGKEDLKERFLRSVDWFMTNVSWERGFAAWDYDFPWGTLKPPWISAMAQGQIVSVLTRAYQLTCRERYLDLARSAMAAFYRDVKAGGVQHRDARGRIVLEEYPTDPPSMVLNGFISAVFGIHDFCKLTGDEEAQDLRAACVKSLLGMLDDYDTGMWSRYDHPSFGYSGWAPIRYHLVHIYQLQILCQLAREPRFCTTAQRWLAYTERRRNRLAFVFVRDCYRAKRVLLRTMRRGL